MKKFFLYLGIGFSSLMLFAGIMITFAQNSSSESKIIDIMLILIFALLDFICIMNLIKVKKNEKVMPKQGQTDFNQYNNIRQNNFNSNGQNQAPNYQHVQQQYDLLDSAYKNLSMQYGSLDAAYKNLSMQYDSLDSDYKNLSTQFNNLGFASYEETMAAAQKITSDALKEAENITAKATATLQETNAAIAENNALIEQLINKRTALTEQAEKAEKQMAATQRKLQKSRELYSAVTYAVDTYFEYDPKIESCKLPDNMEELYNELAPTVTLGLHAMDVKTLNKAYRDNDKQISTLLEQYQGRYTTKTNQAVYSLIVIGLRSELQNILTNLKYDKLDNAIDQIKTITAKYLAIAGKGNQNIAATLTKFIGATEYLFINAAKIEYDYYVKKEQIRQEQIAIKEKMRQEAKERKALEDEKRKIEAEEKKYHSEIEKVKQQIIEASEAEKTALEAKILQLQSQLSDITVKKDTIVNLQNGKAGNIYIISNLGSFGENVFKIGMTRRLNPQERIDELGSASVPFKFDVHSFIFSEDAVALETELHHRLNDQRVNRVNMRKEFFRSSVDELAALVEDIDPTAEFNKTMLAEEYRQSISGEVITTYSFDEAINDIDELVEA